MPFSVETVDLDGPRDGEALVKMTATGLCHTDLLVRDQWVPFPLPAVLGHEGAGVIEEVGPGVTKVRPGDGVVLSFSACGSCPSCWSGRRAYCYQFPMLNFIGSRPDGSNALHVDEEDIHGFFFGQSSFATHAIVSEASIVPVRTDVDLGLLGPLACGMQTGAGAVLNSLRPPGGSSLVVFGTGAVGLSAVMAAKVVGCTTIVGVDLHPARLDLARELGASHVIDPAIEDPVEVIARITGAGSDFALDTTGSPSVIRQAASCLAPLGTLGILGGSPPGSELQLDMGSLIGGGRSIRGIVEGDSQPDLFIPLLIRLHESGHFPFDRLVRFYPLDKINQAADDALSGETIKPVLRMY
jgi:aryl-alcohol dehydrogenase